MWRLLRRFILPILLGACTTTLLAGVLSVRDRDAGMRGSTTPERKGERLADASRAGLLVPMPLSLASAAWARTLSPEELAPNPAELPARTLVIRISIHERTGVSILHSEVFPFSLGTYWAPTRPPATPEDTTRGWLNYWQAAHALPWLVGTRAWPDVASNPDPPFPPHARDALLIKAAGWPLRSNAALLSRSPVAPNSSTTTWRAQGGFIPARWNQQVGSWVDWRAMLPGVIPLRPLWPGFFLNTAVYSGLWWLVLALPGGACRYFRRRRGACAHCGYSRVGLPSSSTPCPECGGIAGLHKPGACVPRTFPISPHTPDGGASCRGSAQK